MEEKDITGLDLDENDYLRNESAESDKVYSLLNSRIEMIHCTEDTYLRELFSAVQEYIQRTNDLSIRSVHNSITGQSNKSITGQIFYSKMTSSTLYNIMESKAVYSLSLGILSGYKSGIIIAMHNITPNESSFILDTISILRKRLNQTIEISNNILYCTHLIISSYSSRQCKLSHAYVLGILFGKAVVNFNWYLDLLSMNSLISTETISLLNTVCADSDLSDSAEMACLYGISEGFFSNVNITGKIVSTAGDLIKLLNGTVDKKSKRPTLKIDTYEELYYIILMDSSKSCYLNLFPGRNYIYHIR